MENVNWEEKLDVFSGLVISKKEIEGVCEIINLVETLYSPFFLKQTHVHSSNQ
jgi:hypothetical protein